MSAQDFSTLRSKRLELRLGARLGPEIMLRILNTVKITNEYDHVKPDAELPNGLDAARSR
jgi:hypothetical protein